MGVFSPETYDSLNVIYTSEYNMIRAVIILILTTLVWILVVYVTKPSDMKVLTNFYRTVRPSGWWGQIAKENPDIVKDVPISFRWIGWLLGVGFIYCSLLGIGYIVTARYTLGIVLLGITAFLLYLLIKRFEINPKGL
jgi:hypothetical protein